jgi:hypothetical protein
MQQLINIPSLILTFIISLFSGHKSLPNQQLPPIIEITPTIIITSTPIPTVKKNPTLPTLSPIPTQSKTSPIDSNLDLWIYPGAAKTTSSNNHLSLESSDNPDKITNWYKDKINSQGMKTQAIAQSNANGNIKNQLSAANTNYEIQITIAKSADQSITKIEISQSASDNNVNSSSSETYRKI